MHYETAAQMAERLNVTIRVVQIWAKDGKLSGAIKQGRDWLIPSGTDRPGKNDNSAQTAKHIPLPLMSHAFPTGTALEFAQSLENEASKTLALAEYYYFSGQAVQAKKETKRLCSHEDLSVKLSAYLIHTFASLALGNLASVRENLTIIDRILRAELEKTTSPQQKAICILIASTATVLLHAQPDEAPLRDHVKYLPRGLQLWACYLLSHIAYLQGEYSKALGIVQTALSLPTQVFSVPMIYLHLSAAMNLMALKKVNDAKEHLFAAWALAQPDDFIEGFGEHHGLLCGLIETCLKPAYPKDYDNIIAITYKFSANWRKIHNLQMNHEIASNLTTTEFSIAMLASRGWSNQEIANFMNMSLHTVKRYISIVYQKLNITSRSQLKPFVFS